MNHNLKKEERVGKVETLRGLWRGEVSLKTLETRKVRKVTSATSSDDNADRRIEVSFYQ